MCSIFARWERHLVRQKWIKPLGIRGARPCSHPSPKPRPSLRELGLGALMEAYETRLETVSRRVEEKLVAVWRETISGLTKEGQPTDLAEKMLRLMEATLDGFRADRAKHANAQIERRRAAQTPSRKQWVGHCGRSPRSSTTRPPCLGPGRVKGSRTRLRSVWPFRGRPFSCMQPIVNQSDSCASMRRVWEAVGCSLE
jgi:hypothetical protein